MKILFVHRSIIPARNYGGRERSLVWLARELHNRGHQIIFLVPKGSSSPFGTVLEYNMALPLDVQIPEEVDLVHVHFSTKEDIRRKPYVVTIGGNGRLNEEYHHNSIFVSKDHAERHNGEAYVYNGIDTNEYGQPDFNVERTHVHFLAKAAWRLKNVKGAIKIARKSGHQIKVLGGKRVNLKMGFRFTIDPNAQFHGMIGGQKKLDVIRKSNALLYPVLWHEPCANAIIESMYFGCPVIGTNWGSLPEIVGPETGYLSNSYSELIKACKALDNYDHKKIHEYTCDNFSAGKMADNYLKMYEKVLQGKWLNAKKPVVTSVHPQNYFTMKD